MPHEGETVLTVPIPKHTAIDIADEYEDAWAAPNPHSAEGMAVIVLDGDAESEVLDDYDFITEEKQRSLLEPY